MTPEQTTHPAAPDPKGAGRDHHYAIRVDWTGNLGAGTATYRGYSRDHRVAAPGKPEIACSSDPAFRGDPARYNPEELLVASLSGCHMLWYLHLCAEAGVVVTAYADDAGGTMREQGDGGGHFTAVTLRPSVTVRAGTDVGFAERLHHRAHQMCFVAASVRFPVRCEPRVVVEGGTAG